MATNIPNYVLLSGKGTPWEGNAIYGFIIGGHRYYVPEYGLAFTKKADGSFSYEPYRSQYYDSIWEKYVTPMGEVQRLAMNLVCTAIAKAFNEIV